MRAKIFAAENRRWWTLGALCFALFMIMLDNTVVNVALPAIRADLGISVSELGKKMKLNHPNYLYRVLPDLQKEGRIRRRGKGYHPGKT